MDSMATGPRSALPIMAMRPVCSSIMSVNLSIVLPLAGGTYHEGVVGYPKNINPLYSSNRDVDRDLSQLIYSSLYRYDENGQLVNDLAEGVETSDNKTFIVTLKNNV